MGDISTMTTIIVDGSVFDFADADTNRMPAFPAGSSRIGRDSSIMESMPPKLFDAWFDSVLARHGIFLVGIQVMAEGIDRRRWHVYDRQLAMELLADRLRKEAELCQKH
jgi:hypothetical protein